ncbi:MAG: hypothetical protein RI958_217 [Actinomycetota bacterium]|jgi:hypothetical protein
MTPRPEWTKPTLIGLTAARNSEGGKNTSFNEGTAQQNPQSYTPSPVS